MFTLERICKEAALMNGDDSSRNITSYLLYARQALEELNLHNIGLPKSVLLDIDPTSNSAELPSDYITDIKIGLYINGYILELGYDKNMDTGTVIDNFCDASALKWTVPIRFQNDCNCLLNGAAPGYYNSYYMWDNLSYNGRNSQPIYSIPAYYGTAFYKISNGRIFINSVAPATAKIALDYKTTGVSNGGQSQVSEEYKQAILAYILWKKALHKKGTPAYNIQLLEKDYQREYGKLQTLAISTTLTSLVRTLRSNIFQGKITR